MTDDQEAHLSKMREEFVKLSGLKYRQGQTEHGGNLWEKSILGLLKEIRAEAIDAYIYAQTAIDTLEANGKE